MILHGRTSVRGTPSGVKEASEDEYVRKSRLEPAGASWAPGSMTWADVEMALRRFPPRPSRASASLLKIRAPGSGYEGARSYAP
jgi:hypothetical protein